MQANSNKASILIVDNDQEVRLIARTKLEEAGIRVIEADSGANGIEAAASWTPGLILLDVGLSEMDGCSTCGELRMLPEIRHVPILMMSAQEDLGWIDHAFELGATDCITKPINWRLLVYRVRHMLRESAAIEELRSSQIRLANAQQITRIGDWEWDIDSDRLQTSAQLRRTLGVDPANWRADFGSILNAIPDEDQAALKSALAMTIRTGQAFALDHRVVTGNGELLSVAHQGQVIEFDQNQKAIRLSGIVQDITDRKHKENRIRQLAYYDVLTDLPNRLYFTELLREAINDAHRRDSQVGLMFLDLDHFKRINDTLGHAQGDELLKGVAHRLSESIRRNTPAGRRAYDSVSDCVARLGGDEFTIIATGPTRSDQFAIVASRVLESFRQPFLLSGQTVFVSPSIGIAIYPRDGLEIETLLVNADAAMYRAKELGRNNFQFYDASMNSDARGRLMLENDLRRAINQHEFFLEYQPKVEISSGKICGAEALIRWQHPERGVIAPLDFIPLAEECGLIIPIGNWVLDAVCRQLCQWQLTDQPAVPVSINMATPHLRLPELASQIAQTLEKYQLSGELIELEVTESMLVSEVENCYRTLKQIGELGVKVAIDDFGTGYSSLAYLKKLPLNSLKIAQEFVRDIATDADDAAIVAAVIALAHSLKLKVVAEGVETVEQLEFLRAGGCEQFQGFLFSRPVSAQVLAGMLGEPVVIE